MCDKLSTTNPPASLCLCEDDLAQMRVTFAINTASKKSTFLIGKLEFFEHTNDRKVCIFTAIKYMLSLKKVLKVSLYKCSISPKNIWF